MFHNSFGSSSNLVAFPKHPIMQEVVQAQEVNFDNSVFSNPFRDKADKKRSILEHHVSMKKAMEPVARSNFVTLCRLFNNVKKDFILLNSWTVMVVRVRRLSNSVTPGSSRR